MRTGRYQAKVSGDQRSWIDDEKPPEADMVPEEEADQSTEDPGCNIRK